MWSILIVMNHLTIDVALKMVDSVEVQLAYCGFFPCLPAFTNCWKLECRLHSMVIYV